MIEIWKDIKGLEGYYQVSNLGRIVRLKQSSGTKSGRIRKPGRHSAGYQVVRLSKNSIKIQFLVHRLVCEAFIGPANGRQVNHKDGDKANNKLSNLEWVTPAENTEHMLRMHRKGKYA
jgi:hypothetical protein